MRNLLLAALAFGALAFGSASAAPVITAGACVPGAFGTPCAGVVVGVPGAPPAFAFGPTPVGAFSVSGSAVAGTLASGAATFNTQTITVSSTTGGLLERLLHDL